MITATGIRPGARAEAEVKLKENKKIIFLPLSLFPFSSSVNSGDRAEWPGKIRFLRDFFDNTIAFW
jgi:hypothetical protein